MMKILKGITAGILSITLLSAPTMPLSFTGETVRVEASTQVKAMYANVDTNAYTTRSSKSKRVMTIPYGVRLERTAVNSSWSQVRYKGITGWVASRDLVEIKKTEVMDTKKAVTLYASRSTKAKAVTKVPAAKQVTRLAVNKSWSQVKYGSKTGWVASSQLKARYVKESFAPRPYQLKEDAPLQSTYTTSGTRLTSILKGTVVVSAERYNSWYKVTFNGKTGWVSGKYLTDYKAPTTTTPPPPLENSGPNENTEKVKDLIEKYGAVYLGEPDGSFIVVGDGISHSFSIDSVGNYKFGYFLSRYDGEESKTLAVKNMVRLGVGISESKLNGFIEKSINDRYVLEKGVLVVSDGIETVVWWN